MRACVCGFSLFVCVVVVGEDEFDIVSAEVYGDGVVIVSSALGTGRGSDCGIWDGNGVLWTGLAAGDRRGVLRTWTWFGNLQGSDRGVLASDGDTGRWRTWSLRRRLPVK